MKQALMFSALVILASGASWGQNSQSGAAMMAQATGAAANASLGATMLSECQSKDGSRVSCAIAAASFLQAGLHAMQAMKSAKAEEESRAREYGAYDSPNFDPKLYSSGQGYTPGTNAKGTGSGSYQPLISKLQDTINKTNLGKLELSKLGYKANADGSVTTPEGNVIPGSALASAQGLSGLGMSEEAIREMQEKAKIAHEEASRDMRVIPMGIEAGGGGGGGFKLSRESDDAGGAGALPRVPQLQGDQQKTRSLAGMKKNVGNEAIGVSVDNIFQMIHRRFAEMRKKPDAFH